VRPYHSYEGFRRLMQMSTTNVFVLVEGKQVDAYIYGNIASVECAKIGLSYEIVRSNRVSRDGGKQPLLALFEYLRLHDCLNDKNKPSFCIFFLDKDMDDVFRRVVRSPYVVYTPTYSVENLLFAHGNLVAAAAAASSLDPPRFEPRLVNNAHWCRRAGAWWKDFVVFCIFVLKYNLNYDCHYGRHTSPLNNPVDSHALADEINLRKLELQARSGLQPDVFEKKYLAMVRFVERSYNSNLQDRIFNGKWYFSLITREIQLAAAGEDFDKRGLKNGLSAALAATLDFKAPWTAHFATPFATIMAQLAN
jgi:hypothetical protein